MANTEIVIRSSSSRSILFRLRPKEDLSSVFVLARESPLVMVRETWSLNAIPVSVVTVMIIKDISMYIATVMTRCLSQQADSNAVVEYIYNIVMGTRSFVAVKLMCSL